MFLGAWEKGELGPQAMSWQHGEKQEIFIICRDGNVTLLIQWLAENYPKAYEDFRRRVDWREPDSVHVTYAEFVRRYPSQSGGAEHVVTSYHGRWTCTCLAFNFGKECWAIGQAKREYVAKEES